MRASRRSLSAVRSEMAFSSAARFSLSLFAIGSAIESPLLSPWPARSRSRMASRSRERVAICAAISLRSSAVLAETKRAAAAEISPDATERRSASVIIGTSRLCTRAKPRSVSENDMIATAAATTVMMATTPKAICSLNLMPNLPREEFSLIDLPQPP